MSQPVNPFNLSPSELESLLDAASKFAENPSTETSIPGPVIDVEAEQVSAETVKVSIAWRIVSKFNRGWRRTLEWMKSPPAIVTGTLVGMIAGACTFGIGYLFYLFFGFLYGISHILAWSVLGALVAQAALMFISGIATVVRYAIMGATA